MLLAMVPAAPPTWKNQRTTSWPAPISAKVPYLRGSRLMANAFCWVARLVRSVFGSMLASGPSIGSDTPASRARRGSYEELDRNSRTRNPVVPEPVAEAAIRDERRLGGRPGMIV